jgi:hypothetical protein
VPAVHLGIIGAGAVGSALAAHWARAGHELVLASRHPERLGRLAARLGPAVRTGTPADAVRASEVVLLAVPFWEVDAALALAGPLPGRVVVDATNPFEPGWDLAPTRHGSAAADLQAKVPEATVVKAFNALDAGQLSLGGAGRVGVLCFADDLGAYERVATLVRDATFHPVLGGGLVRAALGEAGGVLHGEQATAEALQARLGAQSAP